MMLIRGLGASLLWILAGLVGLLGAVLTVTLILAPVGIPLLMLAKRLFGYSMVVMMPNRVRHPVQHAGESVGKKSQALLKGSKSASSKGNGDGRKTRRSVA